MSRVPVQIRFDDNHELTVTVAGVDLTPSLIQAALKVDDRSGPVLYLELHANPDIDIPAEISTLSVNDAREFLRDLNVDDLRKEIEGASDFASSVVDQTVRELRRRAGL